MFLMNDYENKKISPSSKKDAVALKKDEQNRKEAIKKDIDTILKVTEEQNKALRKIMKKR